MGAETLTPQPTVIEIQGREIDALAGYAERIRDDLGIPVEARTRMLPKSGALPFEAHKTATQTFGNQEADFLDDLVWWMRRGTSVLIERQETEKSDKPRYTVRLHDATPESAPSMGPGRELNQGQLDRLLDGLFPIPRNNKAGSLADPTGIILINEARRSRIRRLEQGQKVQIKPPAPALPAAA